MKALITAAMITTLSFSGIALADQYEEYERLGNFGCLTDHNNPSSACNSIENLPPTAAGRAMHVETEQNDGFMLNGTWDVDGGD